MSHPLMPRHDQPLQQQASFCLPEEITSKGAPAVVEPMGEISPTLFLSDEGTGRPAHYGLGVRRLGP